MNEIKKLKEAIKGSKRIVIFSGAGLSTNSGIPDFRSADGLYNQRGNYTVSPEEIISHSFFISNPDDFYRFYFDVFLSSSPVLSCFWGIQIENISKIY